MESTGRNGDDIMAGLVCFLAGLTLGGCISFVVLCCFQINRINDYESEIKKLKEEIRTRK